MVMSRMAFLTLCNYGSCQGQVVRKGRRYWAFEATQLCRLLRQLISQREREKTLCTAAIVRQNKGTAFLENSLKVNSIIKCFKSASVGEKNKIIDKE